MSVHEPDVVGQPYGDAVSAIEEEGSTPVVASRIGGKLAQDDCIVTNAWDAPFLAEHGHDYPPSLRCGAVLP